MTDFGFQDYQVPPWSAKPSSPVFLEVIKDGVTIEQIRLSHKQFYLIGKHKDLSDIVLENPTISRKHAIIQFKKNQDMPYLYDLASTHGTNVNRNRLPSRVYHKLNPYDTIQFGGSSRMYVLRCPKAQKQSRQQSGEYQQEQEKQINQNEEGGGLTEFQKMLSKEAHATNTPQQLKEKYLNLLENDPLYRSQQGLGRKLQGSGGQKANDEGVSWGISDEAQVYAFRAEGEFPLEPDLLRRLPGLDNVMLGKISQFQEKLGKYEESEGELRDLSNKEQRQYGLQEKLRAKKQNLEKKTVQLLEDLEKVQDYIRVHLFGQKSQRNISNLVREKERDTFDGDEFLDRTLAKKEVIDLEALRHAPVQATTDDYWKLKHRLEELLAKRSVLNQELISSAKRVAIQKDMDEYERYMAETENKLNQEKYAKVVEDIGMNNQEIEIYRNKLEQVRPEERQDNRRLFTDRELEDYQKQEEQNREAKKKQLDQALNELQSIKKKEEEQLDEEDESIFKYYEQRAKHQGRLKRTYQQFVDKQLEGTIAQGGEAEEDNKGPVPTKRPAKYISRNKKTNFQEEDFIDLTRH